MADGPVDDYYALLGVDGQASAAELRRAWRRLALRWHPDRAGASATRTFQKIAEAYAVLSEPAARAAYDRRRASSLRVSAAPPKDATVRTERRAAPASMIWRLSGSLSTLLARGVARRLDGDVIELLLNADEASQGGMVTISMRVPVRCPLCAIDTASACARCGTARSVEELFSAWLAVPPDVADGTTLAPSALLPGMLRPVSFRVNRRGPLRGAG